MAKNSKQRHTSVVRPSFPKVGGWILGILIATAIIQSGLSWACNIPVFRYGLENWQPDQYPTFVLYRQSLSTEQQQWVDRLESASADESKPSNLVAFSIDVDELQSPDDDEADAGRRDELPAPVKQFLASMVGDDPLTEAKLVTFFPFDGRGIRPVWSAPLTNENVDRLLDSPQRTKFQDKILDGDSAVWVLIESGDKKKDDEAYTLLVDQLKQLEVEIKLPDQELLQTDEFFRPETQIELRVAFSAIRLGRDDAKEAAFRSMLLSSEDDLKDFDEPIAIPIYGRGRTYFALVGRGINADTIEENCRFICGACSCQVKRDNPGVDMLMSVDWQGRIVGTAMREVELPELTGVGLLDIDEIEGGAQDDSETPAVNDTPGVEVDNLADSAPETLQLAAIDKVPAHATVPDGSAPTQPPASPQVEHMLFYWIAGLIAFGVVVAGLATFWITRAGGK